RDRRTRDVQCAREIGAVGGSVGHQCAKEALRVRGEGRQAALLCGSEPLCRSTQDCRLVRFISILFSNLTLSNSTCILNDSSQHSAPRPIHTLPAAVSTTGRDSIGGIMKVRKVLTGVVGASVLLSLAACSSNESSSDADATGTVRLWVMEGSLSDESQQYLVDEFAEANPGSELKIEVQQWDGIVSKLQTSLASKNESPDLVEIGNTQTTTFTSVGAFADVTDLKETLGGDDLIPSFVDAATIDDKIYAYPLYAGARG